MVALASLQIARTSGLFLLPWLLLVFPAIHLGSGFGALNEFIATVLASPRRALNVEHAS